MGQINFSGEVIAGPATVTDPAPFPGGQDTISLTTTPPAKTYLKHEHKTIQYGVVVNQVLDFTGISATFIYLRCNAAITFRVNGLAADIPLFGTLILEPPTATPVTSITITTTAETTIEYLIAGS